MLLPAAVCMPNNQDFPDLVETSGRFSADQTYWTHFLMIQMSFETAMAKETNTVIHTVAIFYNAVNIEYTILV